MDKITTSERNRVVAIMEDAVERLMLLSYVPEQPHEAILGELEAQPYEVFQRHWEVEKRARSEDVGQELAESSRAVCRARCSSRAAASSAARAAAVLSVERVVGTPWAPRRCVRLLRACAGAWCTGLVSPCGPRRALLAEW